MVLKPGGRLMISDIVLLKELPDFIKESVELYISCVSGALLKDEYLESIKSAGFEDVRIIDETLFPVEYMADDPTVRAIIENSKIPVKDLEEIAGSVMSVKVHGVKP